VIEEARRRQQRRRTRLAIAIVIAAPLIAVAGALIKGSKARPAHPGLPGHSPAGAKGSPAPTFNVRLAPTLEVGRAGWQFFYEEHGSPVAGVTTGPAVRSEAYVATEGAIPGDSQTRTTIIVTSSKVAAVQFEGATRVPTVALSGLPYGYRAARILTPAELGPPSLVPLDAHARSIVNEPENRTPRQAHVRAWRYPGATPAGSCGLRASPMPGLTAQAGKVATAIRPLSAANGGRQVVGRAFLPCVSIEYHLDNTPLRALVLLDADDPSAPAAALPDFKPVSGAPGFLDQGGLTATRAGNAWLIVAQGSGTAQRVKLMRHLTALVKLHSLVPASGGVPPTPAAKRRQQAVRR
jgi:hypothetical protein